MWSKVSRPLPACGREKEVKDKQSPDKNCDPEVSSLWSTSQWQKLSTWQHYAARESGKYSLLLPGYVVWLLEWE